MVSVLAPSASGLCGKEENQMKSHVTAAHPASELFPIMDGKEFDDLVGDIREHGQREAIVVYDGQILDGRNRYRACQVLGLEPVTREWDGKGTPEAFVVSMNLHRRHLNETQRATIGAKIANMRQGKRTDLEPQANLPEVSIAEAAHMLNVGERSVKDARVVLSGGTPEEIEAVERGEAAVSTTARKIRKRGKPADAAPPAPRPSHPGPKINIPDGETPESLARAALQMRADGLSLAESAKQSGISQSALSKMCDIVTIADHAGLPAAETETAHVALKLMNDSHKVINAWPLVDHIANRLWGSAPRNRRSRKRAERYHLDGFLRPYEMLLQVSTHIESMDIPILPKDRLDEIDAELHGVIRAVTDLRKRIKELHR